MLLLAFVTPACSDSDFDDDEVDVAIDDGNDRGESLSDDADDELDGASELEQMARASGILLTLDHGEIMHAEHALALMTDPVSADFANLMIEVHSAHADQVDALAIQYGFEPVDGEVSATLVQQGANMMKAVQASSDPAHLYMRQQVELHEQARVIVDGLVDHFDPGELRDFLVTTRETIRQHREHAIEILRGF